MNAFDLCLFAALFRKDLFFGIPEVGDGVFDGNDAVADHFLGCCEFVFFRLRLRFCEFLAEFVSGTHETVFLSDAYECHVELLQHVLCDVLLQIYTNLRQ